MRAHLTPSFVRNVPLPSKGRSIYWDSGLKGFGLQVMASGKRTYVVQYRNTAKQSRRIALSGILKVSAARKEAMAILTAVAKGSDPVAQRRHERAVVHDTLKAIGDEYVHRESKELRSIDQRRDHLKRLVYPALGARPIGSIKRSEIVRLLDKIADRNGPVMADAVLATLRRLFSWHAARSDEFRSPIVRGMARTKPAERRRRTVLSDEQLRAVWKAASSDNGPFGPLLKFILLTAARRNEAAGIRRDEIAEGEWIIPATRHKSKKTFIVPLSEAAGSCLVHYAPCWPPGRRGICLHDRR